MDFMDPAMRPIAGLLCRIVNIEQLETIAVGHETTESTSATFHTPSRGESMASESISTHGPDPATALARLMHSFAYDCSYRGSQAEAHER